MRKQRKGEPGVELQGAAELHFHSEPAGGSTCSPHRSSRVCCGFFPARVLQVLLRFLTQIIYKPNQISITWFQTTVIDSMIPWWRFNDSWHDLRKTWLGKAVEASKTAHPPETPATPNRLYFWFWGPACAAGRSVVQLLPAVISHHPFKVCPFEASCWFCSFPPLLSSWSDGQYGGCRTEMSRSKEKEIKLKSGKPKKIA